MTNNNATTSMSSTTGPRRGRGIAIAFTVVGLVIAGSGIAVAAASAARIGDKQSDVLTADAEGVQRIDVNNSDSSFTVVFDDVDEATLTVQTNRAKGISSWNLTTQDDTLVVHNDSGWFSGGPWFGFFGEETVTLTLPEELNGKLELDLQNSAGAAIVTGDFVTADIEISAGDVQVSGVIDDLAVTVSAGSARLAARDVETLDVEVSAGSVRGTIAGTAPTTSMFSVSAGDVNLAMPDEEYRVSSDVSFGDADIDLDTNSSASRSITVNVSAGDLTLRRD